MKETNINYMWDYFKLDGNRWNNTCVDEQLEILNKYYPIGSYYHYIADQAFNHVLMVTGNKESYCKLLGYVLNNDYVKIQRPTFSKTNNSWYLLHVEQSFGTAYYLERKYDTRHPGFFYPAVEINRKYKLDSLLDV